MILLTGLATVVLALALWALMVVLVLEESEARTLRVPGSVAAAMIGAHV